MLLLWSFQGAREPVPARRPPAGGRSLKTQQRGGHAAPRGSRYDRVEVDVIPGEPVHRTAEAIAPPHAMPEGIPGETTHGAPTPIGVRAPIFPRKEVIQPHLPVRLPCYDFTPIIDPTFDGCLLAVSSPASGIADFRGVTGGVYKPRVRIHRGVADPRLLATPPS